MSGNTVNLNEALTSFGHEVKAGVQSTVTAASENMEDEPYFHKDAIKLLSAHTALIADTALAIGALKYSEHDGALDIGAQDVAEAIEEVTAGQFATGATVTKAVGPRATVEAPKEFGQSTDILALREQTLACARGAAAQVVR
ncbi:hypothetical protein LTR95_002862 [Oleoguttula sp. CCFEE 5521]